MEDPFPKVSCYCATYGRPWALEEALESFLRQDYPGEKELVILNDFRDHTLHFDHPEVKIFNTPNRIMPLGKKFNETVALCTGDVLCPWEDDDVYLPHKLTYSIGHMIDGLFHTGFGFYEDKGHLVVTGNYFHCNLAISRDLWNRVGQYAEIDKCDLDIDLMGRLFSASPRGKQTMIPNEDIFYVYRWGTTGSYHASGWGTAANVRASVGAECVARAQTDRMPRGEYILKPHWSYDYVAAAKAAVKKYCSVERDTMGIA